MVRHILLSLCLMGCAGTHNRQLLKIEYAADNMAYFSGDGGVVLYKRDVSGVERPKNPCMVVKVGFKGTAVDGTTKKMTGIVDCDSIKDLPSIGDRAVTAAAPLAKVRLVEGDYYVDRDLDGEISILQDGLGPRRTKRYQDGQVCVMPPVQAARESSASGSGSASVGVTGSGQGAASGSGSSDIDVKQLFEHSQAAWFLQVALYRLCEARLNGLIETSADYKTMFDGIFKAADERLKQELTEGTSRTRWEGTAQLLSDAISRAEARQAAAPTEKERLEATKQLEELEQKFQQFLLDLASSLSKGDTQTSSQ